MGRTEGCEDVVRGVVQRKRAEDNRSGVVVFMENSSFHDSK